jgi:hypothetical protein
MSYVRTAEHRALMGRLVRQWQPWKHSTGPKSPEGKAKVSQNAFKGAWRQQMKELRALLKEQDEALSEAFYEPAIGIR